MAAEIPGGRERREGREGGEREREGGGVTDRQTDRE